MKLSSVVTALLIALSLAAVPACKKDKKKADDKAGEMAPADDKAGEKPAGDMAGEAKAEPAAAAGDEAKAEPAAAGEPTEVKKDEAAGAAGGDMAGGEKKDGK